MRFDQVFSCVEPYFMDIHILLLLYWLVEYIDALNWVEPCNYTLAYFSRLLTEICIRFSTIITLHSHHNEETDWVHAAISMWCRPTPLAVACRSVLIILLTQSSQSDCLFTHLNLLWLQLCNHILASLLCEVHSASSVTIPELSAKCIGALACVLFGLHTSCAQVQHSVADPGRPGGPSPLLSEGYIVVMPGSMPGNVPHKCIYHVQLCTLDR